MCTLIISNVYIYFQINKQEPKDSKALLIPEYKVHRFMKMFKDFLTESEKAQGVAIFVLLCSLSILVENKQEKLLPKY